MATQKADRIAEEGLTELNFRIAEEAAAATTADKVNPPDEMTPQKRD